MSPKVRTITGRTHLAAQDNKKGRGVFESVAQSATQSVKALVRKCALTRRELRQSPITLPTNKLFFFLGQHSVQLLLYDLRFQDSTIHIQLVDAFLVDDMRTKNGV
jgi:hypothetical protein